MGPCTAITVKAKDKVMNFEPGQFAFIGFEKKGFREKHPFTIASTKGKTIRFVIKNLGDFTSKLSELTVGTITEIEGPYGMSTLSELTSESQIWVAGGIGVTPFLAYAQELKRNPTTQKITMYYSVKEDSELVLKEEFEQLAQVMDSFTFVPFVSNKQGRLTLDIIEKNVPILTSTQLAVCGPLPLMQAIKEQALGKGMSINNIKMEEFALK